MITDADLQKGRERAYAFVEKRRMARRDAYVARGRKYAALSLAELRLLYLVAFEKCARNRKADTLSPEGKDIECEIELRGHSPLALPEIRPARDIVCKRIIKWIKGLSEEERAQLFDPVFGLPPETAN